MYIVYTADILAAYYRYTLPLSEQQCSMVIVQGHHSPTHCSQVGLEAGIFFLWGAFS